VAYDQVLAARVRSVLSGRDGLAEKRMFGGLAFLLNGNMSCGVHGDELILRLAPEQAEEALQESYVRVFDMTGRPMKGWVLVSSEGLESDAALSSWLGRGAEFAASLPPR
jgi:TfoX/Sxy family transcriptional regulator of competence genes